MPPSLRDWLAEDHLAWFVIDAVGRLDLQPFYAAYRADGHGRAAYEPSVMVSLVLYAYSTDERSSRGIKRRCRQDIAYRVITGNQVPDHATIARFIRRHQRSLNELFGAVLRLCARAGLVNSGVVAVDGTKLTASASSDSNVDYDRIALEIIAEAIATDGAEDEQHGDARGNELPPELAAEITTNPTDWSQLRPMLETAIDELQQVGVTYKPEVVVADAQYWNEQHIDHVVAEHGCRVLIPPDGGKRQGERPGWTGGRYSFMRAVLQTELGKELYRKRQKSIEPVFGHTKHNRKIYRLNYRGRALVSTEWRLAMLTIAVGTGLRF